MLWDRSEPNGYAHRMTTNPLPDTPPHEVLMNVAFGDHQVSTWQADVEARTIGAQIHDPVVFDGRWPGVDVAWGVDPHGHPRVAPEEMQMVSDFLMPDALSAITDTCLGPCYAGGYTGP